MRHFVPGRGSGGDLQGVLDADQVPYEPDVVRFITNLLEGLAFLHDRNIAHLDIKVGNQTHARRTRLSGTKFLSSVYVVQGLPEEFVN